MAIVSTIYNIGDIVYLKTDPEQLERMVTGIILRPNSEIYEISIGGASTDHYDIEMRSTINQSKKLGFDKKEEV